MKYYLVRICYKILIHYFNNENDPSGHYVRSLQDILVKLNCLK